jgi:hypothetical protein
VTVWYMLPADLVLSINDAISRGQVLDQDGKVVKHPVREAEVSDDFSLIYSRSGRTRGFAGMPVEQFSWFVSREHLKELAIRHETKITRPVRLLLPGQGEPIDYE